MSNASREKDAFMMGWELCEQSYQTTIQFGCNLTAQEYWEQWKEGKINKEGQYVG